MKLASGKDRSGTLQPQWRDYRKSITAMQALEGRDPGSYQCCGESNLFTLILNYYLARLSSRTQLDPQSTEDSAQHKMNNASHLTTIPQYQLTTS